MKGVLQFVALSSTVRPVFLSLFYVSANTLLINFEVIELLWCTYFCSVLNVSHKNIHKRINI